MAEGRLLQTGRLLPVLPASLAPRDGGNGHGNGNGHGGHGHDVHGQPRAAVRRHTTGNAGPAWRRPRRGGERQALAIPSTVPFIGWSWDDVLFLLLAATMIGSALLVVTMRDIIRCGLALMVALGALSGIFVLLGAPLVAAAEVLVYIGGITVLILFAIMLTQSKAAPARLVFQTQAVPAAVAAVILAIVIAITVTATDWGAVGGSPRRRQRTHSHGCSSISTCCRSRSSASCSWRP